jgi:hypothetical protein
LRVMSSSFWPWVPPKVAPLVSLYLPWPIFEIFNLL